LPLNQNRGNQVPKSSLGLSSTIHREGTLPLADTKSHLVKKRHRSGYFEFPFAGGEFYHFRQRQNMTLKLMPILKCGHEIPYFNMNLFNKE